MTMFGDSDDEDEGFKPKPPPAKLAQIAPPVAAKKKANMFGDSDEDEDSFLPSKKTAPEPVKPAPV